MATTTQAVRGVRSAVSRPIRPDIRARFRTVLERALAKPLDAGAAPAPTGETERALEDLPGWAFDEVEA